MIRSDIRNKEIALGRIKRLASSGLPVEPFVRSVFELIDDAVPHSPHRSLHCGDRSDSYICSTPELAGIVALHNHYFVESPARSGVRRPLDLQTLQSIFPTKSIWREEEVFVDGFRNLEGFNETYRPLGWHHNVATIYQEAGEFFGAFGMWRTLDQPPFGPEDIAFLKASAPHIAHGLRAARLLANPSQVNSDGQLVALENWTSGVIWLDHRNRPTAMDTVARLIFQQIAIFDGVGADAFGSRPIQTGLEYVRRRLAEIFSDRGGGPFDGPAPVYRLFNHWTGTVLKLRAVRMSADGDDTFTTIIVERGESAAMRRRRYQLRWGLSDREAEVLALVGNGKTGPEISAILGISHNTARKHLARIFEKVGVENRTEAALKVRDAR